MSKDGVGVTIKGEDELCFTIASADPKPNFLVDRWCIFHCLRHANGDRDEVDVVRVGVTGAFGAQQIFKPGINRVHGQAKKEGIQDVALTDSGAAKV